MLLEQFSNFHTFRGGFVEAKVLVEAFEQSLKALRLVDREDPATLLVAEKVLEAARGGERDMQRLRTWVLAQFGASPP